MPGTKQVLMIWARTITNVTGGVAAVPGVERPSANPSGRVAASDALRLPLGYEQVAASPG